MSFFVGIAVLGLLLAFFMAVAFLSASDAPVEPPQPKRVPRPNPNGAAPEPAPESAS